MVIKDTPPIFLMGGGILLIRKVCVFMEKENNRNDKCNKCNKFNNRVKYILLVLFGSAFICAAFFLLIICFIQSRMKGMT